MLQFTHGQVGFLPFWQVFPSRTTGHHDIHYHSIDGVTSKSASTSSSVRALLVSQICIRSGPLLFQTP